MYVVIHYQYNLFNCEFIVVCILTILSQLNNFDDKFVKTNILALVDDSSIFEMIVSYYKGAKREMAGSSQIYYFCFFWL